MFRHSFGRHALPHTRRRFSFRYDVVPILALLFTAAFVAWPLMVPHSGEAAAWYAADSASAGGPNILVLGAEAGIEREDGWTVSKGFAQAPASGTPDPGTAQRIALEMLVARGYSSAEYDCLNALWKKESGWNHFAMNRSSGAYGIPQALPGEKMASAGADWATNPETQIRWGLGYIEGRYGSPCAAWDHSVRRNWY